MAIALMQVEEPVPLEVMPSQGVPLALANVIHKCLAKAPEERFQTAAELESELALLGRFEVEPPARPETATPSAPSAALRDSDLEEADDVRELMEAVAEGVLEREIPPDLQFELERGAIPAREQPAAEPAAEPAPERPSAPEPLGRSKASAMRRPTLTGAPAPARDRPPRVLVVDDEPAVRRLVKTVLGESGCETLEAVTGQGALEILHDRGADLVVMDVQMPLLDGFDTARILKSQPRFADVPIIFASGHLDRNRLAFGLQAGATDFVEKPFDVPVLVDKVWRILTHLGFARPLPDVFTPCKPS